MADELMVQCQYGNVTCKDCGRVVEVKDGKVCTHGPGPGDQFICPGSGDKGMVKAGSFKIQ
jgi:hypothetical protein